MKRIAIGLVAWMISGCSSEASDGASVASEDEALSVSGYTLPWAVGEAHAVGQGDRGVLPGGGYADHTEHLCNGAGQCGQLMIHAIDFSFDEGAEVHAAKAGTVKLVYDLTKPGDPCFEGDGNTGRCAGKENSVVIAHDDGLQTQYLHFSAIRVHPGQRVAKGEVLGKAGSTGQASGPHLHFQIQHACGVTMCQSIPIHFEDGVGLPKVGDHVVRSSGGAQRCWSDALGRYVHNACVEKPSAQGTWHACVDGAWQPVPQGQHCPDGAPAYGFCQTETGDWLPPRACHPFRKGRGWDWKQCGAYGAWSPGAFEYASSPLGGTLGDCSVTK